MSLIHAAIKCLLFFSINWRMWGLVALIHAFDTGCKAKIAVSKANPTHGKCMPLPAQSNSCLPDAATLRSIWSWAKHTNVNPTEDLVTAWGSDNLCSSTSRGIARKPQSQEGFLGGDHPLFLHRPHRQVIRMYCNLNVLFCWATKGPSSVWELASLSAYLQSGAVPLDSDSENRICGLGTSPCTDPSAAVDTCTTSRLHWLKPQMSSPHLVNWASLIVSGPSGVTKKSAGSTTGFEDMGRRMRSTNSWKDHSSAGRVTWEKKHIRNFMRGKAHS